MVKTYLKIFILISIIEITTFGILYSQVKNDLAWHIYENIFSKEEEKKEKPSPIIPELKKKIIYPYPDKYKEENILLKDYYKEGYKKKILPKKEEEPKEKEIIYVMPPYTQGKVITEDEIDYGKEAAPPEYPEYIYHPRRIIKPPNWRELPYEERPRLLEHISKNYSPSIGGNIGYFFFSPKDISESLNSWVATTYSYFSKKYSDDLSNHDKRNIFVIPKDKDGKEITSAAENKYQGLSKGKVTCLRGSAFYNGSLSFKVKPNFFLQFRGGSISTLNTAYINYTTVRNTRDAFTDENNDGKDDDPDDTRIYTQYAGNFAFNYSIEVNAFPLILNGFLKYPYEQFRDTHLFTGLGLILIPTNLRVKIAGISEGREIHIEDDFKFSKTIYGILFLQGFRLDITDWLYFDGAVDYKIAFGQKFELKDGNYNPREDIYFDPDYFTMSFTGFGINCGLNISF